MFREYREKLLRQLSVDLNCAPADFQAEENVIILPALNEGRRSYSPGRPFLQMATLGGNAVLMADEGLQGFLRGLTRGVEGHRLFEFGMLAKLDEELQRYGYRMSPTHHMFLPCRGGRAEERFQDAARRPDALRGQKTPADARGPGTNRYQVRWLDESGIRPFYGDPRFPNAIAYPVPCPVRPDRIAVLALDGDTVMGMAGCSEDAPGWQQIGIDVLPAYRGMGVGTALVTLLKNRIIERGDVPFYGTAAANIPSQCIALNSGFRPAWVETEAVRTEEGN